MQHILLFILIALSAAQCPVFQRVAGSGFYTQKNSIPMPIMNVDFDLGAMTFKFSVQTVYLREESTYVIDFTPFYRTRSISSANVCENRLASSFVGVTQKDMWRSATNATMPGALNTRNFLAYGPSNNWNLTAVACNVVKYERTFTFSELMSCTDGSGTGLITERRVIGTNLLEYEGAMYVTLVNPIWNGNVLSSYETIEYRYPFLFKFGALVQDVVAISAQNNFNLRVLNVKIDLSGRFVAVLRTEYKSDYGDFLHSPSIKFCEFKAKIKENMTKIDNNAKEDKSDEEKLRDKQNRDPEDEGEDAEDEYYFKTRRYCDMDSGVCYQEWVFSSLKPYRTSYVSTINLDWIVADCSSFNTCNKQRSDPRYVSGTFKVAIDMVEAKVGQIDFKTKLTTYNALAMTTPTSGPFTAGDRVYVKDELSVALADADRFAISLNNVWICFPETSGFIPRYDPSQNSYGCARAVNGQMPNANIVHIVKNQRVSPSNFVEQQFDTRLYAAKSLPSLPYVSTVGFSFSAQSLAAIDTLYYIHVETLVKNGTQTRTIHRVVQSVVEEQQGSVSTLFIQASQSPITFDGTSESGFETYFMIAGLSFGALGLVLCCMGIFCTCFSLHLQRRRKNKE